MNTVTSDMFPFLKGEVQLFHCSRVSVHSFSCLKLRNMQESVIVRRLRAVVWRPNKLATKTGI